MVSHELWDEYIVAKAKLRQIREDIWAAFKEQRPEQTAKYRRA